MYDALELALHESATRSSSAAFTRSWSLSRLRQGWGCPPTPPPRPPRPYLPCALRAGSSPRLGTRRTGRGPAGGPARSCPVATPTTRSRRAGSGSATGSGFTAPPSAGSIGRRASHGCIRMRIRGVKHLYRRVHIDTGDHSVSTEVGPHPFERRGFPRRRECARCHERTRPGWRAARWMPTAAPSDMPATCACSIPMAPRKAATWSA